MTQHRVGADNVAALAAGPDLLMEPRGRLVLPLKPVAGVDGLRLQRPAELGEDRPESADHRLPDGLAAAADDRALLPVGHEPVGGGLRERPPDRVRVELRDVGVREDRRRRDPQEPVECHGRRQHHRELLHDGIAADERDQVLLRRTLSDFGSSHRLWGSFQTGRRNRANRFPASITGLRIAATATESWESSMSATAHESSV
jgi:hypothetical protein